tara:strand:+ start:1070 stop:2062 length:993 start_codon:yes stop_codon:yes gene_type:complete
MEKSMQGANEKMVPIDTSGDPVEVELKDEKEKEESVEVQEEQATEPVQQEAEPVQEEEQKVSREKETEVPTDPYETGDLDSYSKGVKKRINNLVGRMREMERLYEASQKENEELKNKYSTVGKGYVSEFEGRVTSAVDAAKSKLKKAIEDNDTAAQVEAQEQLAAAKADTVRLSSLKASQKRDEELAKQMQEQQSLQAQQMQQNQDYGVDYKAEEWASRNPWFNNKKLKHMRDVAMAHHEELLQEGFDPTSDEYYSEIDSYIRKVFPTYFEKGTEDKKTETKQPVQTVASAVRKTKSGRRVVKLTPSQVAIAKRLNVPLEEYAKHVKEGA